MRERPILFSAPMVRAILDRTKTQTRRVCKLPSLREGMPGPVSRSMLKSCPYGTPGDRLWVRETWGYGVHGLAAANDDDEPIVYKADDDRRERTIDGRWHPSIHMPRASSRITLQITSVEIQRLQGISHRDAIAEGITATEFGCHRHDFTSSGAHCVSVLDAFASLWTSINGAKSWEADPWVWVVTFKVLP